MQMLGEDELFDEEESVGDVGVVSAISTLTFQMGTLDPAALQKKTARDAVIRQAMRFTRDGWPQKNNNVDGWMAAKSSKQCCPALCIL